MSVSLTRSFWRSPSLWLTTTLGVGFSRWAPGTCASFVACVVWWFWQSAYPGYVQIVLITGFSILGYLAIESLQKKYNCGDHPAITVDEVIGQWVALISLPQSLILLGLGFLAFRLLDILKPYPVLWCQEELPGAFGVIGDDVMAGLLVCGVFHFFYKLLEIPVPPL